MTYPSPGAPIASTRISASSWQIRFSTMPVRLALSFMVTARRGPHALLMERHFDKFLAFYSPPGRAAARHVPLNSDIINQPSMNHWNRTRRGLTGMAGLYELAQNRRRADSGGELGTFRRFLIDHDGRVKAREASNSCLRRPFRHRLTVAVIFAVDRWRR